MQVGSETRRGRFLGLILLGLCAALWFIIIPRYVPGSQQSLFPRMVTGWIALFSLLTMLFPPKEPPAKELAADTPKPWLAYGFMIIAGAYAVSLNYLGFYISTFVMLGVSMYHLGIREVRPLLIRPAVALAIVYILLQVLLNLRLPEAYWQ